MVLFLTRQDGHLVAAGAILDKNLVAFRDGGVVEELVKGIDALLSNQAHA